MFLELLFGEHLSKTDFINDSTVIFLFSGIDLSYYNL